MTASSESSLLSIDLASQRMATAVSAVSSSESVPLLQLAGRVLAEPVVSPRNVPPADNSAMDGYALRHHDLASGGCLRLVGKAFAGQPFGGYVDAGTCVRITTGAEIPAGTDTVVMQEDVESDGESVRILSIPAPTANVRRTGEDIARGETVLAAGRRLGAVDIGLLASLGVAAAPAYPRLRVAVIATGDELKTPGSSLAPGEIYESNRYVIGAMLSRLGAELIDLGVVPDDPALLRAAFVSASVQADAVIVSGGASVGEADYTHSLLAELGAVNFWQVAIKPGKPFLFGRLGTCVFFGLPGNPVSALVTFHQLVAPVLRKMQGENAPPPLAVTAATTQAIRRNRSRVDLQRGWLRNEPDDSLSVTPDSKQGSAALSSMARSNCFIWIEPGPARIQAGDPVRVLPFDDLLR